MASNVSVQLYRGLLANLGSAPVQAVGSLAWTTDSDELWISNGSSYQRLAAGNQVFTAASQAAQVALAALIGDICVRSDNTNTYMLTAFPATNFANWTQIATGSASDVQSVNSVFPIAGNVSLTLDNIPDGATYARILKSVITSGEFDLAKSHQLGFTHDNLIQPSALGVWQANTSYTEGQVISDPTNAGDVQQVIVAGMSGASQPAFQSAKGAATTDGTAMWENIGTSLRVSVKWLAAPVAHEWVAYIDNDGVQHLSQPAFSDISGTLSQTQLPASIGAGSNLTDIDCGTF